MDTEMLSIILDTFIHSMQSKVSQPKVCYLDDIYIDLENKGFIRTNDILKISSLINYLYNNKYIDNAPKQPPIKQMINGKLFGTVIVTEKGFGYMKELKSQEKSWKK